MMIRSLRCLCAVLGAAWLAGAAPVMATEYVVPAKGDVGVWFSRLPKDATSVVFSAADSYHSEGDILLPPRTMLVIDGRGCKLTLGPNSNGFTNAEVADMKQAMLMATYRYVIKDFADIRGGRKAIDFKSSFGSVMDNLNLSGQTEAAIDLRFCLLARLRNIRVTHPRNKGIVLRQGDWKGATGINSQCNSSVLEQCRVYCHKTTTAAFTILNSNGVRMTDCVSEGEAADYDLFLSATMDGDESRPASNPVVKSFMLSGFHVEHQVRKASIYVNMPVKAVVNLENVYWNAPISEAPVLLYTMGQVNLTDIGWWNKAFWIGTRINAPRITIAGAPSEMELDGRKVAGNRAGFMRMVDPLRGNSILQLPYVQVQRKSM
ncbi:MAG: hypothetical protein M9900_06010 [Flavobacteriales bacterium]|nr:hypothetical protein [Flavobacteriales bacterium]